MLWSCGLLRAYWDGVIAVLYQVTGLRLTSSLEVLILSLFPHSDSDRASTKNRQLGISIGNAPHYSTIEEPRIADSSVLGSSDHSLAVIRKHLFT